MKKYACIWSVLFIFLLPLSIAPAESTTVQNYDILSSDCLILHVAQNGSRPFTHIQNAIDAVPWNETRWAVILVHNGLYNEKIRIHKSRIIIKGEDREKTRIEYPQLRTEFEKNPDKLGPGIVNIFADEVVLDNLTVANTANVVGPHQFAVYGNGDRIILTNSSFLGLGGDTVSLWESLYGCYYHDNCFFKGAVDFVCPRGWCYISNSTFYEVSKTAAIWHDGRCWKDYRFVIADSRFDGVAGWKLGRYHQDAQFFLLRCSFSSTMADEPVAPVNRRNPNIRWGERVYYSGCRRDGGDYAWFKDNLAEADSTLKAESITPAWTFGGRWDPMPIVRETQKISF